MPRLVRAAALTHYVAIAQSVGLDPWRMVRDAQLPAACLDNPDLKVPVDRVTLLLEASAAQSGQEAFGLLMVEGRRLSNLGVLGLLTRDEPTLRAAFLSAHRYGRMHNESLVLRVEEAAGFATIYEDLLTDSQQATRQGIEMAVGVAMRLIKVFLGPEWRARRVCFSHPEPTQLAVHRRVLGQTPEFNCEFNGIVCTSTDLDTPIASADPVMSDYLRQQLQLDRLAQASVGEEVRQMILLLMPRGRCTADQIAQLMGIHRRTLHRRLESEGQSYALLLQGVRQELAQRYVAEQRRSLGGIAQLLGFGELSSFSRWYKTSFGRPANSQRRG